MLGERRESLREEIELVRGASAVFDLAAYRAARLNVTTKIYPEARHETLNEINRDEVTADLLAWINQQTVGR